MKKQLITTLMWLPIVLLTMLAGRTSADREPSASVSASSRVILSLEPFASGLNDPVGIVNDGTGNGRLLVVERAGRIRIVESDGTVLPTPFLDIQGRVDASSGEQGLLGLVFDPDYTNNDFFYVNYTYDDNGTGLTRISRFSVTGNPNIANASSEEVLLTIDQPFANHNAGDLHFGPDGFLYIPMGDGGGGGDPSNNAQNMGLLLGKIVRIDVDGSTGVARDCAGQGTVHYTIPTDNPFRDGSGPNCDEIWALGLRNPWRFSFDRATGDMYIGDVGQNAWEEINFQAAASNGGENYGWRCYEGNHPFNLSGCGLPGDYIFPIFEYNHSGNNCSVTGGYVYRGSQHPELVGRYLLTDYCSGIFWDLTPTGGPWRAVEHPYLAAFGYTAFGEAADGELYVANRISGTVSHITSVPAEVVYLPMIAE